MNNGILTETEAAEILETFHNSIITQDFESWLELFSEDAIFEFPYAPEGYTKRLVGIQEIRNYIYELPKLMNVHAFSNAELTITNEKIVAEYTCDGVIIETQKPYQQTYISVIHTKGGKITRFKDYWNPVVVLNAVQN
ncbi:nuclear transport factor 2 family protein [Paenibacillus shunpengii]|uniref:Nuclear transport factor 2 family protein n=1 Tax=Paenibacillus shunpengii TaxID=2054424 RepID=A0ABW5SNI0_9BACL